MSEEMKEKIKKIGMLAEKVSLYGLILSICVGLVSSAMSRSSDFVMNNPSDSDEIWQFVRRVNVVVGLFSLFIYVPCCLYLKRYKSLLILFISFMVVALILGIIDYPA